MPNDIIQAETSDEITVIVRTADQARKAEVSVSHDTTCGELIANAVENWSLTVR